ncbi:hypothetical protein DFH11DRAFT_1329643 [Phellopilus nigrolimitatus]|nr:hypothetical protein DFH11DRAFT_1329643 [Phellopilus nigrolimitatus]
MSQAHPALSSTAFPYPLHRPFLYRPFVPDSSQNDPFEDDDDASFSSASGYTCSLHPSGMSTNATMSDIVGPGRILDKYVYQRGGRLLERAIFRVSYKMMIRRLEDAIGEDFYSALWRASCSDETTGLAGLLHVWGVQDILWLGRRPRFTKLETPCFTCQKPFCRCPIRRNEKHLQISYEIPSPPALPRQVRPSKHPG